MLNYKHMSREKLYTLLFSFYIFLLPLTYIVSFSENPYEYPKFILFISGVFIFCAAFLILSFFNQYKIKIYWAHKILIVLSVSLFISDIFGLDPRISLLGSPNRLQGFITFFSGVLLFFLTSFWIQIYPQFKKYICYSLVSSGFFISLFAIFQFFSLVVLKNQDIPHFGGRVVSTFGNPDFLGGFLALLFPLVLFLNNKKSSFQIQMQRKIKMILFLLFSTAVLISQSRSAILGILVSLFIFSYIVLENKKVWKRIVPSGILLCFILALNFIPQRVSIWDSRLLIWQEAVKAFFKNPLAGYGQENFELIFPKNYHFHVDATHNIFLEFMIAGGAVSLILFLAFLAILFKKGKGDTRLMLIVFLITASFNPISISQWMVFWVIAGIIVGLPKKNA